MGLSLLVIGIPFATVGLLIFLKRRRDKKLKICDSNADLEEKIAIVTGANCGLGLETAYELAKRKATVVFACRNKDKALQAIKLVKNRLQSNSKLKETANNISFLLLDLGSIESVEKFVENFEKVHSKLDILVNNAGIMGAQFSLSSDGIESHFAFNHLGHFHLTNLLIPSLKKSTHARVINITSGYYRKIKTAAFANIREKTALYDPLLAYAQSKLAQCLHTLQFANMFAESEHSSILAYAVRPGFVRGTELGRHFSGSFQVLAWPLIWFMSKDVQQGVQTILHCCLAPVEKLKSGALYNNCEFQKYEENLVNQESAKKLWNLSEQLIEEISEAGRDKEKLENLTN